MNHRPTRLVLLAALATLAACDLAPREPDHRHRRSATARGPAPAIDDPAAPASRDQDPDRRAAARAERERRRAADREARARRQAAAGDDPDWPRAREVEAPRHHPRHPGAGYRRAPAAAPRHRAAYARLGWAGGDFDFKDGRGVHDNRANLFRFQTGAQHRNGTGGGIDLKYYDPKHDAYTGTPGQTALDQLDLFAFVTGRRGDGRLQVPVRFGPYYNLLLTRQNPPKDYTRYHGFGLRIELEPQWDLVRSRDTRWTLFTALSAGGHYAQIDDELTDQKYDSVGTTLRFAPGIRYVHRELELQLSYHVAETAYRKSSTEDGVTLPRVESEFRGFEVSVGWRF